MVGDRFINPAPQGANVLIGPQGGVGLLAAASLGRRASSASTRSAELSEQGSVLVELARQQRVELQGHMEDLRSSYAEFRLGVSSGLAALRPVPVELPEFSPVEPTSGRFRRKRDLQQVAELFCRTRAPALMAEVLHQCKAWAGPMARGVARNSAAEGDDLSQVALLAVMRALERYDPEIGPFEPYARVTLAGEVRHYLRATEWALRVPRRLQEGYREVAKARDDAAGESLSDEQLGLITGLDPEDVRAVSGLRRRAQSLQSMPATAGDRCLTSTDIDLEAVPDVADLDQALAGLGPDARELIELYYFQDMSQRDVAQQMGTNQVRVSRLLNQALVGLRRQLAG